MLETKKESVLPGTTVETSSSDASVEDAYEAAARGVRGTVEGIVDGEVYAPKLVASSDFLSKTTEELKSYTDNFSGQITTTVGNLFIPQTGDPGDGTDIFKSRKLAREKSARREK